MKLIPIVSGAALLTLALAGSAHAQRTLPAQCRVDTDCDAPLVCLSDRCSEQCKGHRDCDGEGSYCVKSSRQDPGVCVDRSVILSSWFPELERDTDRWGDDLKSFPIRREDPLICHSECALTRGCVAWTYTEPGVNGQTLPRCYLKNGKGQVRANSATISGQMGQIRVRRPDASGEHVRPADRP